jgi:membrane dipeptidase
MVGLTWNRANLLAQGIVEDTGAGLSTLGRELVSELNRTGIMLDLTHLSATSFFDALKYSTGPVLASHSNASSVWENPRNLTDDQIKAIAERDGIIGLNFLPEFVGTREVINRLVDHVDHIASLVGLQFVALGPDFIDFLKFRAQGRESAQYDWVANELEEAAYEPSARLLPGFHKALLARGFSEEDARSVMYGNATDFLRKNL